MLTHGSKNGTKKSVKGSTKINANKKKAKLVLSSKKKKKGGGKRHFRRFA